MVDDFQRRLVELRFVEGVEKVEHVPYSTGDEFWVRFNRQLDLKKFESIAEKHGFIMVKFGAVPSKLPRALAEVLWDGVNYVMTKKISGWTKFTASLGFEPDGIAKIATDAHGPYQIFISTQEEGVQILYEYLDLKYVPPAPPPKPVSQPKSPVAATAKPAPPTPKPIAPATPAVPGPATSPQVSSPSATGERTPQKQNSQA
jgi:hypothetical protein